MIAPVVALVDVSLTGFHEMFLIRSGYLTRVFHDFCSQRSVGVRLSLYPPSLAWQTLELFVGLVQPVDVVMKNGAVVCIPLSSNLPGPPLSTVAYDAQDVKRGL